MEDAMTLEDYIAEEKARLEAFEKHWRDQQMVMGKEIFPDEMEAGEWDEQFRSFGG